MKDKHLRDIVEGLNECNLPEHVLTAINQNPSRILTALKQTIKDPNRLKISKEFGASNNSKTPYGFLHNIFNNAKKRYSLSDYSKRTLFILRFLHSDKFMQIFKNYEDSNFNFFMKPKFKYGKSIDKLKVVKKGYKAKYLRRENTDSGEYKYFKTIREAADEHGLVQPTISKALADGAIVQNMFKFKYVFEKESPTLDANIKKEMQKAWVDKL